MANTNNWIASYAFRFEFPLNIAVGNGITVGWWFSAFVVAVFAIIACLFMVVLLIGAYVCISLNHKQNLH